MENVRNSKKNIPLLILMASITLMAILCELMPSGVLPQMGSAYGIPDSRAGILVGAYAVASAFFGIPLISLTVSWDRKKLLLVLLVGFAISNIIVSLAPLFEIALIGRIMGGICAGTLWPMITAYGMELVDLSDQGKAVTIIMSGITVGMSLGLPFMTYIGARFGYRASFLLLGISLIVIAFVCNMKLPKLSGEKKSSKNSPFTMIKNKGVLLVMLLTFLGVGANYGLYTFITSLISECSYPTVTMAQMFFGFGSVVSVFVVMKYIDKHLNIMLMALYLSAAITMSLFYFFRSVLLLNLAFTIWGMEFGSLSGIFQTATARQVTEGTAVANSIQSAAFNFSIMIGSTGAGFLLDYNGVKPIVLASLIVFTLGFVIVSLNQRRFM